MIVLLAGGVGGAKLAEGLYHLLPPEELTIIVNVGDDEEFHGLHVSPDIDIVIYTLAGIVDESRGWGIKGDSFNCLEQLGVYGHETWFRIGDRDMATHIHRTMLLRSGRKLHEAVDDIRRKLGVRCRILPATDDRLRTMVETTEGTMTLQEYFVKHGTGPEVKDVWYEGEGEAEPAPGVIEAIESSQAVVIAPSNPILSIRPILAVKGIEETLEKGGKPAVAVSPLIGGRAVKGPADRMMRSMGLPPNPHTIAKLYQPFLTDLVIDAQDREYGDRIEATGVRVHITETLMKSREDKVRLAHYICSSILGMKL